MKIEIGKIPYLYPIPIVLVGTLVNQTVNFEVIGDISLIGINPALICISSHVEHHTNIGILQTGLFSINIPTTKMLQKVDYCGIVSGKQVDKSKLFEIFTSKNGTPLIMECPVNIECKLIKEFSIKHRQVFIGEVEQTWVTDEFITTKKEQKLIASIDKLDPIMYALDNRYYSIGKAIGTGYEEGKRIT